MTAPAVPAHPDWCDPAACTADQPHGEHRTTPVRVDSPRPGYPVVEVSGWLYRDEPTTEPAVAEVTFTRTDGYASVEAYEVAPDQLRALAAALLAVADLGERGEASP